VLNSLKLLGEGMRQERKTGRVKGKGRKYDLGLSSPKLNVMATSILLTYVSTYILCVLMLVHVSEADIRWC